MAIYQYRCPSCNKLYTIIQGMNDVHSYQCPKCGTMCVRVFSPPIIKKNEDFFSVTLGKRVKGQRDFEEGLSEVRYMNDLQEEVGDNRTPKDEWIEKKMMREKRAAEETERESELLEEANEKNGWYESIETFKFEPEKYKEIKVDGIA